ncbi:MAG: TIGR03857 family LLM class F420-dependent oxidoreductase, partial [Candidatus Binatia bacterium]
GPAGRYPNLQMTDVPEKPPPMVLAAVGPKTLAMAGEHFDGVLLHPFLTPEAVARSRQIVHQAAERARRDPATVKIYSVVVVAPDLSAQETALAVFARAATYFVHRELATPIVAMNGWDTRAMERILATSLERLEMEKVPVDLLRKKMTEASKLIPKEWIETGSAVGTAAECAARLAEYRCAGSDEIILHGTTTDRLEALVNAYGATALS